MARLLRQFASFLAVGGIGFVVDVSLFNLLRATVLDPAQVAGGAIAAKTLSTLAAIAVNWVGNRFVTFRSQRRSGIRREALAFLVASLLGSSMSLLSLAVSHYLLGFTSAVADNISANLVGMALGTALRFLLYRTWVFAPEVSARPAPSGDARTPTRLGSASG